MKARVLLGAVLLLARVGGAPAAVPPSAEQLHAIYKQGDYFELETQLARFDPADVRRVFFEGLLDAAFLRDDQAEQELGRFLALPRTDGGWRVEAWLALGGSRLRRGDYAGAAQALTRGLAEPAARFTADERRNIEQDLAAARVLAGSPPQTRAGNGGPATLPVSTGKFGLLNVDVRVNGQAARAMLDTLAGTSCATESFARRHKLRLLPGTADIQSATDHPVAVHIALAGEVQVGKITLRNVAFAVLRDGDLALGVDPADTVAVGIPVILALGRLRFVAADSTLEVGLPPGAGPAVAGPSRNLAFDGLFPLVRLQYQNEPLPFRLDTGAQQTTLATRFVQRFPQALADASTSTFVETGVGGQVNLPVHILPTFELSANGVSASARHVVAFTKDVSFGPPTFGTIGEDLLTGGFEIDFRRMQFSLLRFWDAVPSAASSPAPVKR